ncbi:MAG: MATE family efflux transporter [Agathobacter sp.]|nr:MATE family efflux transporter [Agathobacter sp.]
MARNTTKNMTEGSPAKLILGFAIPMLMGMLFQQVYNFVDTIIVGRYLGVNALAAVGSTGSIHFLIIGFCIGVCSGFTLPVAQRFGAKDYDGLRKYVGNSAILAAIIAVVLTLVTTLLCRNILEWMQTPADIIDDAYNYILVTFVGIPVIMLYNILSGYIRALGDSTTPVIYLVISSFLNIGLDILFIVPFQMGVFGASLATVLSQLISGVLCFLHILFKFDLLHLSKDDWRLNPQYVRAILSMGLPMGLQYSITAIGSVILQSCVNPLGSVAVASMTASGKISGFMMCPLDALGSTMATYGGQNVGAGKLERLGKGLKSAIITGWIYSVIAFCVAFFFGKNLIQIFVETDDAAIKALVIDQGNLNLVIALAFYPLLTLVNTVRFTIQGMGFSGFAVFAGVAEMIARALVGVLLVPIFGFTGACFAGPAAWLFADAFLVPAYFSCYKKLQRIMKKEVAA